MNIQSGSIIIYRLFDVCWEIDLAAVEQRAGGAKRLRIDRKRFSKAFEFTNPPVTLHLGRSSMDIKERPFEFDIYAKVYDYGALSIIIDLPVRDMSMQEFAEHTRYLREENVFEQRITDTKQSLLETFKSSMRGRGAPGIEEDYTVYYIKRTDIPMNAAEFLGSQDIGGLLLSEENETAPSEASKEELIANSFSYSENDLVVVSWDNALVLESSGSMDIPDLLEFANSQLLELRVYDQKLDREMDAIYDDISTTEKPSVWKVRKYRDLAAKMMITITDFTEITEKIDNSLKVTDDVYYAKVYAATLRLFKVGSWATSIKRKIDIASRTYNMLYQEISTKRQELLEVIIIILIAIEIVFFIFLEF